MSLEQTLAKLLTTTTIEIISSSIKNQILASSSHKACKPNGNYQHVGGKVGENAVLCRHCPSKAFLYMPIQLMYQHEVLRCM